jgi:hypothetical protein
MKKIRLSENELIRVIERVIKEGSNKNHKVARPKRRNLKEQEEDDDYVDVSFLYEGDELIVSEEITIDVLDAYKSYYLSTSYISPDDGVFKFVLQVYGGILCIMDRQFFIIREDDFDYLRRP